MKEILVTWGSKYGGTEGIARMLGESLEARGKTAVTLMPAAGRPAAPRPAAPRPA